MRAFRPMNIAALRYASLALLLSGCATFQKPTHTILAPFDKAEATAMLVDGPNTVEGSAVVRTRGGEARTCAGIKVELVPATAYATERMLALYGSTERGFNNSRAYTFVPDEADYDTAVRQVVCDAQGRFRFTNVADGTFYVVTSVQWDAITSYEGGMLMQRVELSGGETASFVMAP